MKKIIFSALAVVAMASCSKSDDTLLTQTDAEVRISSSIATRTIGNTWEAGDAIGVYMTTEGGTFSQAGGNVKYTTTDDGDNILGEFNSNSPLYFPASGNVALLAYYPYSDVDGFNLTQYPVVVSDQTDQGLIDLMSVSIPSQEKVGAVAMTFSHKLSRIALEIKNGGGVEESELAGMTVTLSGTATTADFDLTAADAAAVSNIDNIGDITLLTTAAGTSAEAIVIPQTLSNVELTFSTSYNTYSASLATKEFAVGNEYTYTVTINNTYVTISSATINAWGQDTDDSDNELNASPLAAYAVGDTYPKGGAAIGVVYEVSNDGVNGKIISLDQTTAAWSLELVSTGAQNETNGRPNMAAVLALGSYSDANYPTFAWVHAKNAGATAANYTDDATGIWYLPAQDELSAIDIQTDKLNEVLETGFSSSPAYWASNESETNFAYYWFFLQSNVAMKSGSGTKSGIKNVRAILAF